MYEDMTYENILARCLDRVTSVVDKREGSVIYDALAPACAEIAIAYIELKHLLDRAYPDTATGNDLTKKAKERGVFRKPATAAVRKALFEDGQGRAKDVPINARFSAGNVTYSVQAYIAPGQYKLVAETKGVIGNHSQGVIFPIDYIDDLGSAELKDIILPGEDEEGDERLYGRYEESLEIQPFGGNQDDYKLKVKSIQGVGGVKVIPTWSGGGTVKVVLTDSSFGLPSPELVSSVQTIINPAENQGKGLGLAPIGHTTTISAVEGFTVNVSFDLTFDSSSSFALLETAIKQTIKKYFSELSSKWESQEEGLIVRVSHVETRVLAVPGVLDVTNTKLNAQSENIRLNNVSIPILGEVTNGS